MSDNSILTLQFQRVLVAHHSPQNNCFAAEGDVLYPPVSKKKVLRPGTDYYFHSADYPQNRSKFGWVKCSEHPFTLEAFISEHSKIDRSPEQYELLRELLSAIAKLPERTPVAGSYFRRGIENPHIELDFHKVFFYPEIRQDSESSAS
jgi:hypothetical protein